MKRSFDIHMLSERWEKVVASNSHYFEYIIKHYEPFFHNKCLLIFDKKRRKLICTPYRIIFFLLRFEDASYL